MAQLQPWQNFYMLLGGASATLVGLMCIAISLGPGLWVHGRYRAGSVDRSDLFWYSLMPAIAYILYLDAGIGLLRATPHRLALDGLAAASVLLIVIGVRNAWDLVVFMAMRRLDARADRA